MAINFLTRATLVGALLAVTACTASGTGTITTPGTNTGGGGGETAKAAIQVSESAPEVQQMNLGDLTPYRIECQDPNAVNKTWIIFYYSPKNQKSYRCVTKIGTPVQLVEVTDAQNRYEPGDDIDETKWKVDVDAAKTNAIQVVQNVNVNVTQIKVTNLILLSAKEFTRRTGTPSQDPVWVCTVDPGTGASPSPSVSPSVMPSASPSVMPTASPSVMPTASPSIAPSVAPSASPSPTTVVNNITNVYINANTGNQISVNTGTQTNTTTTQTM